MNKRDYSKIKQRIKPFILFYMLNECELARFCVTQVYAVLLVSSCVQFICEVTNHNPQMTVNSR